MCSPFRRLAVFVVGLASCVALRAEVSLSDLFADHMMLQADQPIMIWGKATPGEAVSVSLSGQMAKAVTGADGKWTVTLPAQPAGGPHVVEIAGGNKIVLQDVLIGEVWLASGQSNMNMRVYPTPPWTLGVVDYERVLAEAKHPEIRFFTVYDESSDGPKDEIHGQWEVCTPETATNFSAVGYFFAKRLHGDLKKPVGVIVSAVGATSILQWLAPSEAAKFPEAKRGLELTEQRRAAVPKEKMAAYETELAEYYRENRADRAIAGKLTPHVEPYKGHFGQPGGLYNAMIAPLTDFRIKGFVWWQGESDSSWAPGYTQALKTLIESWRAAWEEPDAPFLYVQTGARVPYPPKPLDAADAEKPMAGENRIRLRFAQAAVEGLVPNTAMAVACDLGHPNVHFPDKKPVGDRLELAALKLVYGQGTKDYRGPIATKATAKADGSLVVDFEGGNGRLVSHSGGTLSGFEIAGADGKYWLATAKTDGRKVTVSSGFVKEPTTVRYGWAEFPFMSLYDSEGLPARPFIRDVANEKAEQEALNAGAPAGDSGGAAGE